MSELASEPAPRTIEVRDPGEWTKPIPGSDPLSKEFWAAAAGGRLLVQQCPACGHRQFYPRPICTACGADPEWLEASGRGTVHTFTVIRQQGLPPFKDDVPYVVAMIDLEEGVRMMGNVTGCAVDEVTIGMPVRAYAVRAEDGVAVPQWEPA